MDARSLVRSLLNRASPLAAAWILAGVPLVGPAQASRAADVQEGPLSEARDVSLDLWLTGAPPIHVDADAVSESQRRSLVLDRPSVAVGSELTVRAQDGVAQLDEGTLETSGEVGATLDATAPVEIRADRFRVDVRAATGVFDGAVEVTQGDLALVCEHLEVTYDRQTEEVSSVVATGGVEIRQGDRLGRGERAVFDRTSGSVELSGSPYLEEGPVRLRGQTIRFHVDGGEISCDGCRAVFGGGP